LSCRLKVFAGIRGTFRAVRRAWGAGGSAVTALIASMERAQEPLVHGRAFVISNGPPRTVAELLTRMAVSAGAPAPTRSVPFRMAWLAGSVAERAWRVHPRGERAGDPPMTAFLAEQLATAHWFDQRETKRALDWAPAIGLDEGFERLASWYRSGASA
jgi:nucleoside-diphosphate-sugar epimerase